METDGGRPSRAEAQAALDSARAAEDAVRYPPLSTWFFVVMAAVLAAMSLAQLLDEPRLVMVPCLVVALVVGSRFWFHRDGVAWVSVSGSDMWPFLAVVLGTAVACVVLAELTGQAWVWVVGAAVQAAIVLRTGHRYRREHAGAR
ncbi:MAG: hypothetical protein Q7T56_17255 [Nocardioidaceae bacterium]|nr:hypothetical protein [Nocardioidaceae bacterium]